jgi:hypothetical protein
MRKVTFLLLAALAASAASIAIAPSAGAGSGKPISGTWVGQVEGSEAYVAIVIGKKGKDRPAGVYLCDSATQAVWLFGDTNDRTLDLPGDGGASIDGTVTKQSVEGTITLADGTTLEFTATRAKRPAGLYRFDDEIDGDRYEGGWIVLDDGTQRGAVIKRNTGDAGIAPTIDPDNPTVTINSQQITAARVKPWTDPNPDPWTDPDPSP